MLQGEVRATVDALAKDLRQAYTGNGNPGIETMLPAELQFVSPDRQTPFHLRRINYGSRTRRSSARAALSTNTGAPPWTFPPSLSAYRDEVGSIANTTVFKYYDAAGVVATHGVQRRLGDDHAHGRQQDVAEPPVHLRDERRDAGGPMSARLEAMRREDGVTMVLMVLVVALLGVVSLALLSSVQGESTRANAAVKRDAAFQAAEAGIHAYMSKLVDDSVFYNHYLAKGESTRRSTNGFTVTGSGDDERGVDVRARLDVPERLRQVVRARQRLRVQPQDHAAEPGVVGDRHRRRRPADRLDDRTTGRSRRSCGPANLTDFQMLANADIRTAPSPRRRGRSTPARTRPASSTTCTTTAPRTPTSTPRATSPAASR